MKKSKRILSAITALAISASAFASMVIPASAADTTYFTVDFSSPATTGINAQGTAGQGPVAYGDYLTFSMGARGSGGDNTSNITIDDGALKVISGNYASSQRGASIAFASTAGVPAFASVDAGNVLEISFKAKFQDAASTIQFFGITSSTVSSGGQAVNDPYLSVASNPQIPTGEWVNVKVSVANDKKGYATITDEEGKLVSAKDFTAAGDSFDKIGFYGAPTAVWIDDLAVKQVANTYKTLTVSVADSGSNAVKNTTIKVDRATELLENGGSITLALPAGTYAIEASAPGYEANAGQKDAATDSAVVADADVTKNLVINEQTYVHEPTTVTVTGGQLAMTAPRTADSFTSKPFEVESVYDQNNVDRTSEATITWSVTPANDKVSVDPSTGVVTVEKGFKPAEGNVQEFAVTATASMTGTAVTASASKNIKISDYYFYEPGVNEASYGGVIRNIATGEKTITNPVGANTTETIVIPEEAKFENGTAKTLTYKALFSEKGYYTYPRYLTLTDTEGNVVIGPIYMSGPANTTGMVMGTASEFADNSGPTWADMWCTFDVNTWVDVNMMFITYSSGAKKVKVSVNNGPEFVYDIDDAATGIKNINLFTKTAFDGRYLAYKDFVIAEADVSGIDISGPNQFTSIPGKTITKDYSVEAVMIDADETFNWTTTIPNATITADPTDSTKAILTVPDTVTSGGTITATSTKTPSKTATYDVAIAPAVVTSYDFTGSSTIQYAEGATETYSITNVKDQNGDDITEYVNPVWSLKGREAVTLPNATFTVDASAKGDAVAIFPTYDGTTLTGITTAPVKITDTTVKIEGKNGQKVLLWNSLTEMEPLAPAGTITGTDITDANYITNTGELNINVEQDETVVATVLGQAIEKPVTVANFSKFVTREDAGEISVADIVTYGATSFNVVLDDGSVITKTAADNKITLTEADFGDSEEAEIIPNYKFDLGGASESGYVKVEGTKENGYGFLSAATPAAGTGTGIQSKGVDLANNSFEIDLPDGRYDMTFYKADTNRTHIRVNGYMTVTEADFNDGDDGTVDPMAGPGVYTKLDVNVTGGVAKINAYDWNKGVPLMAAVEITKKSDEFQPRKTHVWIAGDSTVCIYRPSPTTDNFAPGTRRTGWGQLLQNYLDNTDEDSSVIVDDFAHSGDWAANWYANTFPSVIQNAEAGDYLIIQFGINDRTRTPDKAVMQAALENMVDECRAKGVIPVIQTPELCVSQYGSQVTEEHTKPNGSGHAAYFAINKTVATEKNTLFIDLGDISATMWATMGKTWVTQNYFVYNSAGVTDNQHMSYQGAKLVASMVATEILDQQAAGKTGATGETFDGIPVNAKVQANVTYTDASDGQQKTIERQAAEFKATVLKN